MNDYPKSEVALNQLGAHENQHVESISSPNKGYMKCEFSLEQQLGQMQAHSS